MSELMRFASWLRLQLNRQGLNAKDLSARLGVDRSTLGRWLAGTSRPSADNLRVLSELLGEPLAILYGLTGYPTDIGALATLSVDELELISNFRKLSPGQQRMIQAAARAGIS
jgi:transcriptional regulator with XRE-family HTH domain